MDTIGRKTRKGYVQHLQLCAVPNNDLEQRTPEICKGFSVTMWWGILLFPTDCDH